MQNRGKDSATCIRSVCNIVVVVVVVKCVRFSEMCVCVCVSVGQ
jgi:hypothetical protein